MSKRAHELASRSELRIVKSREGYLVHCIAHTSEAIVPADALQQVKYVATGNASPRLWAALRTVFTELRVLTLDAVHLAMVYEYATYRRRTAGSAFLRAVLARFSARPASQVMPLSLGPVFAGGTCREFNSREVLLRGLLRACSMSNASAKRHCGVRT